MTPTTRAKAIITESGKYTHITLPPLVSAKIDETKTEVVDVAIVNARYLEALEKLAEHTRYVIVTSPLIKGASSKILEEIDKLKGE